MRAWTLFAAIILVGCASHSQKDKVLVFHGIVQTEHGRPLGNVKVTLYEDFTSWSWNPANWFPRPDRKIVETRTNRSGAFTLSTSENIPRGKLKIVAERVKRLMPYEDAGNPASIKTPLSIKNPSLKQLNSIIAPDGFVPER